MAEQRSGEAEDEEENDENENINNNNAADPEELFSYLLQPAGATATTTAHADPQYISIRLLLLHCKTEAGVLRRRDCRCNGNGYVSYWNYICKPSNSEISISRVPSVQSSTPGNSGRWILPPSPLSCWSEVDSCSSGRDVQSVNPVSNHRTSFGSSASDHGRPRHRGVEPAYSFVGMHCIFDQCKASGSI